MHLETVRKAKLFYFVVSLAFCVIGLMLMIYPEFSLRVVSTMIGICLITFGAIKIFAFFRKKTKSAYQIADTIVGIVMIVLGILILFKFFQLDLFVGIVLAISLLIDGLAKCNIALESRKLGFGFWGLGFAFGIISIAVAIALLTKLSLGGIMVAMMIGASIFIAGISNLVCAYSVHKL